MPFVTAKIEGGPQVIARLAEMPNRLERRLVINGNRFGQDTVGYVRRVKLMNGTPLHRRSGNLSASIHSDTQHIPGVAVICRVYSDGTVPYARIHEFGGVINVPARESGASYRRGSRGHYAGWTEGGRYVTGKEALYGDVAGRRHISGRAGGWVAAHQRRAYTIAMPQRSYLRTSLAERSRPWLEMVGRSIAEAKS